VRRKDPDKLLLNMEAEEVGFEYGIYDVQNPTADLPADFADREWERYEGMLPGAIRALGSGVFDSTEWQTILQHVQAVWARHPDFARDVADQRAAQGQPRPFGDDVQRLRKQVLLEVRTVMASSRFALLRRHCAARRFLVDDKGFVPLGDEQGNPTGVFLALSGSLAVLMALGAARPVDSFEQGPLAERTVNARGAEILNNATWDHIGIRCVIGHPDDADYISTLQGHGRQLKVKIRYGPYRGNRERGFFDWC
jgi:hypothetical protein